MSLRAALLAASAVLSLSVPAHADESTLSDRLDTMQKRIDAQASEIRSLRHALEEKPAQAAHSTDDAFLSLKNGRPAIKSGDGRFTAELKVLAQLDGAYYMQHDAKSALGPDLSSGFNVRRARLGLAGKAFGDWSYFVNFEFGGTGNEGSGRLQAGYIEYDGFGPLSVRVGAYPAPAGLEDAMSVASSQFMEKNAPASLARSFAGGDGRDAATLLYRTPRVFAALSYAGGKVGDSKVWYDEQSALLGNLAGLVYDSADAQILLDANGTYMFSPPDAAPGIASGVVSLSEWPELTVDDTKTKFVSTGTLNAESLVQWGVEAGAQWHGFYGQAGYFGYDVNRGSAPDRSFHGWYAQASYVLLGGPRRYKAGNGSFSGPKPSGKWGALEAAGRYSDLDLNDASGFAYAPTPAGGVRGGEQKIWSFGLNWYPNEMVRFGLDYQWVDVNRLDTAGTPIGQSFQAVSFRTQFAL